MNDYTPIQFKMGKHTFSSKRAASDFYKRMKDHYSLGLEPKRAVVIDEEHQEYLYHIFIHSHQWDYDRIVIPENIIGFGVVRQNNNPTSFAFLTTGGGLKPFSLGRAFDGYAERNFKRLKEFPSIDMKKAKSAVNQYIKTRRRWM